MQSRSYSNLFWIPARSESEGSRTLLPTYRMNGTLDNNLDYEDWQAESHLEEPKGTGLILLLRANLARRKRKSSSSVASPTSSRIQNFPLGGRYFRGESGAQPPALLIPKQTVEKKRVNFQDDTPTCLPFSEPLCTNHLCTKPTSTGIAE
jgi:hypothetical protein